ncbi:hypothetical protein HPB48_026523 [Haemaphysalis longicornis]|uniref:SGNH hydrolase-type esterase domain-containing protein n=1 Tax=Haemaphysalis longicornis TaxID=44386 RepID=A0A9J6H9Y5_HAELO|nr:hypothetical protein HPB48_026523 [Haemaphysalis longicornis]
MAASKPATERLSRRFPKFKIKTAIVGDSLIRHVFNHFDPSNTSAPGFVSYGGAMFEDVLATLEYLPTGVETLVLHVGTVDIARRGSAAAVAELKRTVERIRQRRPEMKTILLSLPLPRAPNRRRGGANRNFVRWFNAEAQRYAREVRQLCRGGVLGPRIFYIDHGFLTLPPWRFLAADGLHASFEGVAVLAQHFKERLRYHRPRWASAPRLTEETDTHDQASPPAGLPPCPPCPPCLPCPQRPPRPTPSRAPPDPRTRYMNRLATKARRNQAGRLEN